MIGSVVLVFVGLLSASQGAVDMPIGTVFKMMIASLPMLDISESWPDSWDVILWRVRLPRIVLAGIVGAALSISGAAYQALFRNPLASPSLIGATSGAGLGATIVLVSGVPVYFYGISILPAVAFLGAVLAVLLAYFIALREGRISLTILILAGVAISFGTSALTSLFMIKSDPDLRPVLSWLLGGFGTAQWKYCYIIAPYIFFSLTVLLFYSRIMNVLQFEEDHARHLGVNLERTKLILIASSTLCTAAAVSFTGPIAFVGLISPHAVRLIWGNDYRILVPLSVLLGASFLILADLVARTAFSPAELPVGVVTALCGVPFFLYLLRQRYRMRLN